MLKGYDAFPQNWTSALGKHTSCLTLVLIKAVILLKSTGHDPFHFIKVLMGKGGFAARQVSTPHLVRGLGYWNRAYRPN